MAQDTPQTEQQQVNRIFEQGPDSVSFYSDAAQVFNTGHEVVLQFYETIPGAPGPGGKIQLVKSRLRATITISMGHASNIGNLLLKQTQIKTTPAMAKK